MKKHLAVLMIIVLILNVCIWTGCGNDASSGKEAAGEETSPGRETAPEPDAKPSLIITEEENKDYYRAARARKTETGDTGAAVISPITMNDSADDPAKVPETGQNAANAEETAWAPTWRAGAAQRPTTSSK